MIILGANLLVSHCTLYIVAAAAVVAMLMLLLLLFACRFSIGFSTRFCCPIRMKNSLKLFFPFSIAIFPYRLVYMAGFRYTTYTQRTIIEIIPIPKIHTHIHNKSVVEHRNALFFRTNFPLHRFHAISYTHTNIQQTCFFGIRRYYVYIHIRLCIQTHTKKRLTKYSDLEIVNCSFYAKLSRVSHSLFASLLLWNIASPHSIHTNYTRSNSSSPG